MLYCPNHLCQTPNPEANRFCQQCQTPLPHRYLWAVGAGIESIKPGDAIAERYVCKASRIFLDTKPGFLSVAPPGELPLEADPYLRLFPQRLHIPQIYDLVPVNSGVILLEGAAIQAPVLAIAPADDTQSGNSIATVEILPALTERWSYASPLRQLNWLWQMAHLWQPLSIERVVSSLLTPEWLRVEGGILRLLELRPDPTDTEFSLVTLGKFWLEWSAIAQPEIRPFLENLCHQMIEEQIQTEEVLINQLDQHLAIVGLRQARQLQFVTRTDKGPMRQRNEDACYPADRQVHTQTLDRRATEGRQPIPYVLVCDGIGGHQGGDVASKLAIEAVQRHVQSLQLDYLTPAALTQELATAICIANDLISQRNDVENRQDRQRMGTTIVLALVRNHELYIAHIGDSRAYWVTGQGCYQVTLDDDLATREVRLGYSFYREALQSPNSGSLVQALGMSPSNLLHPTVQRFVLDEDGVFLLCSDGLSDNDRVEQFWGTELLPILKGKLDVGQAGDRLITLANTLNGHDNTTIGLLHIRVSAPPVQPPIAANPLWFQQNATLSPGVSTSGSASTSRFNASDSRPTAIIAPRNQGSTSSRSRSYWPFRIIGILLLATAGAVSYLWMSSLIRGDSGPGSIIGLNNTPKVSSLPLNALVQVGKPTVETSPVDSPLALLDGPATTGRLKGRLAPGGVLQILESQGAGEDRWLRLKVCSTGQTKSPIASPTQATEPATAVESSSLPNSNAGPFASGSFTTALKPNDEGWIKEADLKPLVLINPSLNSEQRGMCAESPATPGASPTNPRTPAPPDGLDPVGYLPGGQFSNWLTESSSITAS